METLSDDLNAMVKAKEITLPQALELNKQKKTSGRTHDKFMGRRKKL